MAGLRAGWPAATAAAAHQPAATLPRTIPLIRIMAAVPRSESVAGRSPGAHAHILLYESEMLKRPRRALSFGCGALAFRRLPPEVMFRFSTIGVGGRRG